MNEKNKKINLAQKLKKINDYWSPKVVSELNDYQFKLVKVKDDFVWHHHSNSDETFVVIKGKLFIDFKNKTEEINEGEIITVAKGVNHKPFAKKEAHVLIVEPRGVKNTGNLNTDLTAQNDVWI